LLSLIGVTTFLTVTFQALHAYSRRKPAPLVSDFSATHHEKEGSCWWIVAEMLRSRNTTRSIIVVISIFR